MKVYVFQHIDESFTQVYANTSMNTYTYKRICMYVRTYMFNYMHTCRYIYADIDIYMYTYIYTGTYTYIYIYTCTEI